MEREPEPCLSSSTRCRLWLSQRWSCCFVARSLQQHRPGTSCPEGASASRPTAAPGAGSAHHPPHLTLLVSLHLAENNPGTNSRTPHCRRRGDIATRATYVVLPSSKRRHGLGAGIPGRSWQVRLGSSKHPSQALCLQISGNRGRSREKPLPTCLPEGQRKKAALARRGSWQGQRVRQHAATEGSLASRARWHQEEKKKKEEYAQPCPAPGFWRVQTDAAGTPMGNAAQGPGWLSSPAAPAAPHTSERALAPTLRLGSSG